MKETVQDNFALPKGGHAAETLRRKALEGAKRRFGVLKGERKERLLYELELARKTQAEGAFLLWESAVSSVKRAVFPYVLGVHNCSLLCFCLGITEVDPLETGSAPERLLLPGERVPPLSLAVPAGKRDEAAARLTEREREAVEIEEGEIPFIDPKKAADFFRNRLFEEEELLSVAGKRLGIEHPVSVGQIVGALVAARFDAFKKGEPPLEFQEEAIGLLREAGFSAEEGERIRRACARKDAEKIDFYRQTVPARALSAGLPASAAEGLFEFVRRAGLYTVCRASYLAKAQYLVMQAALAEGGAK